MKSVEQVIGGYKTQCLDGRDITRLCEFLTEEQLMQMGIELKEEFKRPRPASVTRRRTD